jgi:hypothetical protein
LTDFIIFSKIETPFADAFHANSSGQQTGYLWGYYDYSLLGQRNQASHGIRRLLLIAPRPHLKTVSFA